MRQLGSKIRRRLSTKRKTRPGTQSSEQVKQLFAHIKNLGHMINQQNFTNKAYEFFRQEGHLPGT